MDDHEEFWVDDYDYDREELAERLEAVASLLRQDAGWYCVAGNNGMACNQRSPHPAFWGCGPVNEEKKS